MHVGNGTARHRRPLVELNSKLWLAIVTIRDPVSGDSHPAHPSLRQDMHYANTCAIGNPGARQNRIASKPVENLPEPIYMNYPIASKLKAGKICLLSRVAGGRVGALR